MEQGKQRVEGYRYASMSILNSMEASGKDTKFAPIALAAASMICYSRIYLAKHFPVDLLLGTGVGILTGLFMLWLYKKSGRGFFKPLDPSGTRQAE